jgi:hypothetical protein
VASKDVYSAARATKACREFSDSLCTLQLFDLMHVFIPKPIPTLGRHASALFKLMPLAAWRDLSDANPGYDAAKCEAVFGRHHGPSNGFFRM